MIYKSTDPILDMGINNGEPVEVTNPMGIKHALADRNIWGGSSALYFDPFGRYWSGNGNDYEILWRGFDLDEANRNLISIVNGNKFDL